MALVDPTTAPFQVFIFSTIIVDLSAVFLSKIERRICEHGIYRFVLDVRQNVKAITLEEGPQPCLENGNRCFGPDR
jgi:hypothetical protein